MGPCCVWTGYPTFLRSTICESGIQNNLLWKGILGRESFYYGDPQRETSEQVWYHGSKFFIFNMGIFVHLYWQIILPWFVTKFDQYLNWVSTLTAVEVSKIYPTISSIQNMPWTSLLSNLQQILPILIPFLDFTSPRTYASTCYTSTSSCLSIIW